MLNLSLTEEDISELERLESNYKSIRGQERGAPYEVGDIFRLTAHMFRHTLAYFVIANKLGELDDIRYQYKHLNSLMTFVYSHRAILASNTLIKLAEGYENLLVDKIAEELTAQAELNILKGGAGEQLNKVSQNLVIGITDSNSKTPETIKQIHFETIDALKRFLAKNLKGIRGLPFGYCTAGEACKIKGAALPSGCVYCPSKIIADRHKVHWRALRTSVQNKIKKYEKLSLELQEEYALFKINWEDTISAADYVLENSETPGHQSEVNL